MEYLPDLTAAFIEKIAVLWTNWLPPGLWNLFSNLEYFWNNGLDRSTHVAHKAPRSCRSVSGSDMIEVPSSKSARIVRDSAVSCRQTMEIWNNSQVIAKYRLLQGFSRTNIKSLISFRVNCVDLVNGSLRLDGAILGSDLLIQYQPSSWVVNPLHGGLSWGDSHGE